MTLCGQCVCFDDHMVSAGRTADLQTPSPWTRAINAGSSPCNSPAHPRAVPEQGPGLEGAAGRSRPFAWSRSASESCGPYPQGPSSLGHEEGGRAQPSGREQARELALRIWGCQCNVMVLVQHSSVSLAAGKFGLKNRKPVVSWIFPPSFGRCVKMQILICVKCMIPL